MIFSKPVPGWVQWVAQDADGAWWGFEAEPNQGHKVWYENEVGRYVSLGHGDANPDWLSSLQRYTPA